ncbi:MFS transporter [Buchnera aphidicola (Rhopalosiphum maidis)]|uniref:MFS transporter n=2 Tax=Buchnera aphidicola TaxID=9 RepID=A0A3G2I6V3_BUCRM|nr:MFS transporter [Buchnera aphidicola (Rhopalosiphum maidis)]
MNFIELQVTLSFCIVFLLRMLGVFSVLPILSKYGLYLNGGNKFLIGLSIGIYGVTQIIFQIPFGILSDRFGRKQLIIFGLFVFFVGSLVSVSTNSIWSLIIGRAIQGSGAISGVSMALLSDLISEENRVKSISVIGASFAISFLISIVSAPIITENFGFFSIFWISAIFSIFCILIVFFLIPSSRNEKFRHRKKNIYQKKIKYIFNKKFFRFYLGVFFLHFLLTMSFLIIPYELELSGLLLHNHWIVYFTTIIISFFILFFIVFYFKFYFFLKNVIEICIFFIFLSFLFFLLSQHNLICLIFALQIFFIAFNILEIFFPSRLSQEITINDYKGSIMSIYSTSQFLGIACGGILNGWLYTFLSVTDLFLFEIFITFIWLIFSFFCKK